MQVLIACEFTGTVRDAFAARGHDAMSVDLVPSEKPGLHFVGDVREVLANRWDLMIAHPPCTYLCNSGVLRLYKGAKRFNADGTENPRDAVRWRKMEQAARFFRLLFDAQIPMICIENPIMHGHAARIIKAKHDQTIQPFYFGHDASKTTCLWLKNLPRLTMTEYVSPRWVYRGDKKFPRWSNQTDGGQNKLPPSETRGADRARTYQGIADAMAD